MYMYIDRYTGKKNFGCINQRIHAGVCVYEYRDICMHMLAAHIHTYIYINICIYVCMCTSIYKYTICIYICIYTHIYIYIYYVSFFTCLQLFICVWASLANPGHTMANLLNLGHCRSRPQFKKFQGSGA